MNFRKDLTASQSLRDAYGEIVKQGSEEVVADPPKHFEFVAPQLVLIRDGDKLTVKAKHFARFVEIEGVDGDVRMSDNFFDMNPCERTVQILEQACLRVCWHGVVHLPCLVSVGAYQYKQIILNGTTFG